MTAAIIGLAMLSLGLAGSVIAVVLVMRGDIAAVGRTLSAVQHERDIQASRAVLAEGRIERAEQLAASKELELARIRKLSDSRGAIIDDLQGALDAQRDPVAVRDELRRLLGSGGASPR